MHHSCVYVCGDTERVRGRAGGGGRGEWRRRVQTCFVFVFLAGAGWHEGESVQGVNIESDANEGKLR